MRDTIAAASLLLTERGLEAQVNGNLSVYLVPGGMSLVQAQFTTCPTSAPMR
jgi:hypothetical protein